MGLQPELGPAAAPALGKAAEFGGGMEGASLSQPGQKAP